MFPPTEDATDRELGDLIQEMKMLTMIGHHVNIINFLGFSMDDGKHNTCTVTETPGQAYRCPLTPCELVETHPCILCAQDTALN